MNRAELVEAIATQIDATKSDTDALLSTFTNIVEKNIKKKDGIRLVGFGTFKVSKRKARIGRNPQTGDEIKIPARTVPVFKPGSALKTAANKTR